MSGICGLSEEALQDGLNTQEEKNGRLGAILINQKTITEANLLEALSIQFGLNYKTHLPSEDLNIGFVNEIPVQFLKQYKLVPVITSDKAFIATNDPLSFQPLDDLKSLLDADDIEIILASSAEILKCINLVYGMKSDSAEQVIQNMNEDDTDLIISEIEMTGDLLEDTSDAPVIKLVNLMVSQAVKERASDIHIEPSQNRLKIRYRVDGILYDKLTPPKHIQSTLISRIKIMAKMDIAEKRLPQDGRIETRIADKNIDIRVSTLPTAFGERMVLRLLDKTNVLLEVSDLGMPQGLQAQFDQIINSAYGILLVTGPTGSGKTTTLYSALSTINKPDINIITIEDPIEYQIDGISQMQVNNKIDLNFSKGLRTIVRQDPDVILVGEIRDLETAEISIQSALTGHMVFSTLHTNDAASAVTRLIDMGIEPFLVTSSVIAILAQRLVRIICPDCRESYIPDEQSLRNIGLTKKMLNDGLVHRGKGCPLCMNTGYHGRCGIFELMLLDDTMKSLILQTSDANAIKNKSIEHNSMVTLRQDGAQKVLDGITTIEEIFRVTQQ